MNKDNKTLLQNRLQQKYKGIPLKELLSYKTMSVGRGLFRSRVLLVQSGMEIGGKECSSKKDAEQSAAGRALKEG